MFTYKFLGLGHADNPGSFYYGSLPAKPDLGHVLTFNETGNRYVICRVAGEGLVGDGHANREKLAFAEIVRGESVPAVCLQKLDAKPQTFRAG